MTIAQSQPKRQNRTITLYLGKTLAGYETTYLSDAGVKALISKVEVADSLDWGCLATGHEVDCPRQLQFTHHDSYRRWTKPFNGRQSPVIIHRVRCLACGAVFSVQPYLSFATNATERMRLKS